MAVQELAPIVEARPIDDLTVRAIGSTATVFELLATAPSHSADPVFGPTSQETQFTTEPDEYVKVRMTDYDTKGDD